MKTVLLLDIDPLTRDLVARAFETQPDLQLVMASSFHGALWTMCEQDVDLVISNLNMPERQGLELLTYMANYRSKVPVLTVSGSAPEGSAHAKLSWRGHLSTTLQPRMVISHVREALRSVERGDYRPVGLHDLLRVLSYERDTCTLQVKAGLKAGHLQLVRGKIVHAAAGETESESAARELLGWQAPWFRIEALPAQLYASAVDQHLSEQVA